jgi:hypothetical protein
VSEAFSIEVCHPAESVTATEEIFAEEAHHFGVRDLDGEELLTGLYEKFAAWQIPRGYVNKLALTMKQDSDPFPDEPKRIYLQDDSGSMGTSSDIKDDSGRNQTRFQEAKSRLLTHMEFLAHVPNTGRIQIKFLNRANTVDLKRPAGESPEDFIKEASKQIDAAFAMRPQGHHLTPIPQELGKLLANRKGKQSITLLFDGKPYDGYVDESTMISQVQKMVIERPDPQDCPITFLSCTENDDDVAWAKELEEVAPFCAEYDDYPSEAKEVEHDQGQALPYSPGMKIVGELVGAECPDDLDAWDEAVPMTKHTLENAMGSEVSHDEYKYYFQNFEKINRDPLTGVDKNALWKSRFAEFAVTERDNPRNLPLVAGQMPLVQQYREQERQKSLIQIQSKLSSLPASMSTPAQGSSSGSRSLSQRFGRMNFFHKPGP